MDVEITEPNCLNAELQTQWACNGENATIVVSLNGGVECEQIFDYTLYNPDGQIASVGLLNEKILETH